MKDIFMFCVKGDVNQTYDYLRNLKHKTNEQIKFENLYYQRFFQKDPVYKFFNPDPWIEAVINVYRSYFVDVLTNKVERSEAELELLESLIGLLDKNDHLVDMNTAEKEIEAIFRQKGFYFLGGKTNPHYGPYIWKTVDKKTYQVELPDTTEQVQVRLLDDFLMISWLHFATFGQVYTGGWAKEDALYCILPRYQDKLDRDEFLVSFLKHEAQHYSDYKQFPKLKAPDLEYRAKLVEVIYYSNHTFFEKLLIQAVNNSNPHNYSAFVIIKQYSKHFFNTDLEKQPIKWKAIDYEDLRHFAKRLFNEHTESLKIHHAMTVEGVI
ncbi:hypothetical protein J14TS2_37820 [Bacillus sp. J14TS2]|uniref:hypothetical protein n=1 Tax=Bacillus sp. J14TS2 TaxID=2807188 RepID=UPI001B1BB332|nr:hypothetical protein [Bacillus sp. J14TS2]GIN73307.1 hypothetical protein J14TS2_37820 [Bacillus sp. J14TS2]